jgi:hypothetical protein
MTAFPGMQLSQPAPLLNFFVRGHERWGKRKGVRNLFEKSRLKRFLTGSVLHFLKEANVNPPG